MRRHLTICLFCMLILLSTFNVQITVLFSENCYTFGELFGRIIIEPLSIYVSNATVKSDTEFNAIFVVRVYYVGALTITVEINGRRVIVHNETSFEGLWKRRNIIIIYVTNNGLSKGVIFENSTIKVTKKTSNTIMDVSTKRNIFKLAFWLSIAISLAILIIIKRRPPTVSDEDIILVV